jgi:hypothetical protein
MGIILRIWYRATDGKMSVALTRIDCQILGDSVRKAESLHAFDLGRLWCSEITILDPMPNLHLFT